jgi:hypothetical protein
MCFLPLPWGGCTQNAYPWVQFEVGGAGQGYFWKWGA